MISTFIQDNEEKEQEVGIRKYILRTRTEEEEEEKKKKK